MEDVTRLLAQIHDGDAEAKDRLWHVVYDELRKLAAYRLRSEGRSIKATELVHEAYMRLIDVEQLSNVKSGRHFFAIAGEAMRRILIDLARKRGARKRGGDVEKLDLDIELVAKSDKLGDLFALDEALTTLDRHDPVAASLVKLRFFGGMKHKEAAEALGLSRREADRLWVIARTWLYKNVVQD